MMVASLYDSTLNPRTPSFGVIQSSLKPSYLEAQTYHNDLCSSGLFFHGNVIESHSDCDWSYHWVPNKKKNHQVALWECASQQLGSCVMVSHPCGGLSKASCILIEMRCQWEKLRTMLKICIPYTHFKSIINTKWLMSITSRSHIQLCFQSFMYFYTQSIQFFLGVLKCRIHTWDYYLVHDLYVQCIFLVMKVLYWGGFKKGSCMHMALTLKTRASPPQSTLVTKLWPKIIMPCNKNLSHVLNYTPCRFVVVSSQVCSTRLLKTI